MPYFPYQDAPPRLADGAPPILAYFQNPRGLLALNLARIEYRQARANGCDHESALEFADAELDRIGLGGRDDVGEWVATGWDRAAPYVPPRRAANSNERSRDAA